MLSSGVINNDELIKIYLPSEMEQYFIKKLNKEKTEYVKLKLCELLKFLLMSHHSYGDIPFNDEIDEIWHLWILQTVQYHELMEKLPTKQFIHHSSNDYPSLQDNSLSKHEALNRQISYLGSYVANFGNFTENSVKFWPTANTLMQAMHINVDQLNDFLCQSISCS